MTESDRSAQTEWFHAFAAQTSEQLVLQATAANRARFRQYVHMSLPKHAAPTGGSAEAFAHAVHELRENERQWNRALMSALIESDDQYKADDRQGAVATLESFAESCPWRLFQEVARDQAQHYGPR